MTTMNPFDLLVDNDTDDTSQLIESASAQLQKAAAAAAAASATESGAKKTQQKGAKLPTKPVPPQQAVREARNETGRGGGRGFGRDGGRGRGGYNRDRDYSRNENAFSNSGAPAPQGDEGEGGRVSEKKGFGGPRGPYRGGRRGGFSNEDGRDGDRPRRTYERHSGTGRGNEFKREGAGRGNWGNQSDEVAPATEEIAEETEKTVNAEIPPAGEETVDATKEAQPEEAQEKEPEEEKEMTLEEYEKVLEEKRKALLALKPEERKVEVDKDLESMQQLSSRRDEESVFIKLGSDKDKKKEASERERTKKSVSINEFLKPADGEKYYSPGGRGRGRGRGPRGGGGGGSNSYGGGNRMSNASAPTIADQKQFPTLGGAPRA